VGVKRAEQQLVIAATPQECFRALVEYETFPDWQEAVRSAEVLSRDEQGRGRDVAFEVDARVKNVRYTLRYSYEEPHCISWEYLDGDVKEIDGEYVLEDLGDGTTLATYSVGIDPGVWLPGPIRKLLNEQVMKNSVEELKKRVEGG
jgi:ribosome-associated toxin RatA of RatAB toxin-antitoxin module